MASRYKIRDNEKLYFLTFTVVQWIDVFSRKIYRNIIIDSLKYSIENKGLELFSYVIMSNHIHIVARSKENFLLVDFVRDFKKFTSKKIIAEIQNNSQESRKNWMLWLFKSNGLKNPNNKKFQFWIQDSHPVELFSNEMIDKYIDYIHNNPVKAGIVEKPEEYLYSSAKNYCDLDGLINVEVIR